MASPFVELEVGERVVKLTNPDKVLFPTARKTKRDLAEYYVAVGEGIVRALYERPTQLRRFPDGVTGEVIYQKRVPKHHPDWVETARVTFPSGRHADELCVTELAQVVWAANLAVVDFHPWPSRRRDTEHPDELRIDIDPQPGHDVQGREAGGGTRSGGARGDRLHGLAEDLGQPRHPRLLPDRAALEVPGRAAGGARIRARSGAPSPEEGHDRVVEGGARQARLHRLQPERARPHRRLRVLGARETGCDRLGPGHLGRAARRRDRGLHDDDDAGPLRGTGDLHAGIDDAVCDLRVLLEWVEREEKEGLGEAPYPPNFPKMPGEPPRVQPSRARKGD